MVTIIIPTYKRANYIERAINSILNQTYKDYKIIVVDDNDPDTIYRKDLENIMEKYKDNDKITYIQHPKNMNGATARNTGINITDSEFVTFLDDDDYFLPERLEKLVVALKKNEEYDAAYSSVIVSRRQKIIGECYANKSGNKKNELLLNQFSFGTGSNLFFRTSTIKELNGFDTSFIRHQDIEVMVRFFAQNHKILSVKDHLVVKVQDDRNNEPNVQKFLDIKENYFLKFKKDIEQMPKDMKNQFYINQYYEVLKVAVKSKSYKEIKKIKEKLEDLGDNKYNYKMFLFYINNYIKIENVKYFIKRMKVKSKLNKNIIKEIEGKY